uniref:Uncharacterized protein n=1 Tax=Solibacter usitatus (strain Ellin6076) TaxID=234267 RepID=Q025Q7_SOLUE
MIAAEKAFFLAKAQRAQRKPKSVWFCLVFSAFFAVSARNILANRALACRPSRSDRRWAFRRTIHPSFRIFTRKHFSRKGRRDRKENLENHACLTFFAPLILPNRALVCRPLSP